MDKGFPFSWDELASYAGRGRMKTLFDKIPQDRWTPIDNKGNTLLHYACFGNNQEVAQMLVNSGMLDPNARNNYGATPLHEAAFHKAADMIPVLVSFGVDFSAKDESGYSAFDFAFMTLTGIRDTERVIYALIDHGMPTSFVLQENERHLHFLVHEREHKLKG